MDVSTGWTAVHTHKGYVQIIASALSCLKGKWPVTRFHWHSVTGHSAAKTRDARGIDRADRLADEGAALIANVNLDPILLPRPRESSRTTACACRNDRDVELRHRHPLHLPSCWTVVI